MTGGLGRRRQERLARTEGVGRDRSGNCNAPRSTARRLNPSFFAGCPQGAKTARILVIAIAPRRLMVQTLNSPWPWHMPPRPRPSAPMPTELSDPADWVDRYGDALLRFAGGRVANHELAEDLVQETFLTAFRHRSKFDGKSSFGTWLVAILRRKIADHHRKSARSTDLDAQSHAGVESAFTNKGKWTTSSTNWKSTPRDLAENAEFWTVFHGCLSGLPTPLAQAFQMREIARATVDDASKKTGVTPQNLAVRLHRARLLLRQCLQKNWFSSESGGAS